MHAANYLSQVTAAYSLMTRFREYATSIGCTFVQDEIEATLEQHNQLGKWWVENANSKGN